MYIKTLFQEVKTALIIFLILVFIGFIVSHSSALEASDINLTCNVSEKFLEWHYDIGDYNLTIDGGSSFTYYQSEGILITDLEPNTKHKLRINPYGTENIIDDYQTTLPPFYESEYFIMFLFTIVFIVLSFVVGIFATGAIITSFAMIFVSLNTYQSSEFSLYYILIPIILLLISILIGWAKWR